MKCLTKAPLSSLDGTISSEPVVVVMVVVVVVIVIVVVAVGMLVLILTIRKNSENLVKIIIV